MKLISKCLTGALILALVLCMVPVANAQVAVLEPGETANFVLSLSDVCAVEGEIEFSDKSIISDVQYDIIGDGVEGLVENGLIFLYADDPNGVDMKISITVTLSKSAPEGSSCNITINYATTVPGSTTPGAVKTVVHSVTTPEAEEPTEPTEPEPTKPTEPAEPSVKYADTEELEKQIGIAQGLTYYEYTKDSWAAVETALNEGMALLKSTSQKKVDAATKALKTAIDDLVPMDYSALQEALDSVGNMENLDEVAEYWARFIAALDNARAQMTSGDQEAVNAAAEELLKTWAELEAAMEEMGQIVEVDKIVEVEPTYDFCNIAGHPIILIIMIVSLAINAILVILIAVYFYKKYRKNHDNTPLVEYDIDEDMGEVNEDLLDYDQQ